MSRAINTSLATIQFQVNARQANAAMQALQNMSNDLNRDIDKVKKNIKNLGEGVPKDNPDLLNYQQQLRGLESQLKDVQKAQRDFLKGAKAADQLWKAASEGNIESLSFRSIKAGVNGLKKRQEGLSPGDAQDMKDWRIIKEVIDEADRVVKQAGADVQNVVQTIREGGKVSEQTMRQTISTLKELKGSVDETDAEYRTYGNDLDFMEAKLQEFSDAQRRAKGEIVDANDARREMNKLTAEGAAAAKREAEEADRLAASLKQESEELVRKRGEIKQNIEDTQKQIDENHKLIEEKHRQLAADEETFNAEQQSRRESIDGLKTQAEAERKLANEKSDAAETHRRAAELQKQTTEQLTEKVTELQGKLAELNAEPVKPKVDASELEQIERKLKNIDNLRKQQQEVIDAYEAKYGKTSDEQFDAQDKVRAEAVRKDVAAREAAVDKVNNKWEEFWKKQEAAAQEFARSLGKSLDEISPEDITSEQLSGPLAKSAQAAYKVTARRDYEFSEALGREGKLTEYKETARRYEGDDSPEAKVIESLQRKYREYTKELREANAVDTESKKIREEQRKESEAYYSALGQMQGFQKVENDLLQQKEGLLKQSAQKSEQQIQLEGRLADAKEQLRLAQEKQNDEQQQSVKLQAEAIEQGNKAAAAETKLADAQSDATQKQVEFNQKQQEGLDNINQMAQGNQALQQSIDGLNGELEQNSKDIADNANKATEAEQKKQQAQQLTIKRMEEMLAMMQKEFREEATSVEQRKALSENIKIMEQALKEAKGETMSTADAMRVFDAATGQLADKVESVSSRVSRATSDTRSSIAGLDTQINTLNGEISALDQHMGTVGSKSTDLNPFVQGITDSTKALQEQKAERQEYIDQFKQEAEERAKSIQTQKEQIALVEKERDESIKTIDERIKAQQENLKLLQTLHPQTETFTQMSQSLEQEIAQLKAEREAIINSTETKEKLARMNEQLAASIKADENATAESQIILDAFDQKIEQTKKAIEDLSHAAPGFDSEELKRYSEEMTSLNENLQQQRKLREEYIATFEREKAERAQAIEKQKEQIALLEKERTEALNSVNARLQAAEQTLAQLKELPDELRGQAPVDEMVQTQLRVIRELQKERFNIASEAEQRLADMNQKLADSIKADEEALAAGNTVIQGFDHQIGQLESAIESYKQKLANAKSPVDAKELEDSAQKMGELQAQLSSLTEQRSQYIEKLRQEADEATRLAEAEKAAALAEQEGVTLDDMRLAAKTLQDAQSQEKNADVYRQQGEAIDVLTQKIKEATGEWMSYEDAKELASKAGGEGFLATTQQMQQAVQAMERQRDSLIKTIQLKQKDGKATADEEAQLETLEKELKNLKFEQDNFNMSHKQMDDLLKQPKKADDLDQLKAAIKRADGELHRMKQSLGENNEKYKKFAAEVKAAKNVLKEMEGQAKATTSAFDKAWSRLKTYVGLYVGASVAMNKLMGTMGDLMELSDKMGEVRKTTDLSADAVGRLTANLKKMDVRTNLVQLEELAASAGQLGLKSEEDILGFTEAANKLMIALPEMGREAATEMMRVAIATGEVDKISQQMEQGLIDGSSATAVAMEKIASTIDRLRASSASTAPEITDFVKRLGAVGAQSGITIDQIAAMGSTISSLGMRVEMSATALSRMIPAIKNNAFAIGKIIGQTEEQIKDKFERGMGMEVILDVFKAIRGNVSVTADDIANNTENLAKAADKVEEMFGGSMKEIMAELNQQGARAGIVFAGLSQNVEELEKQLRTASRAYEENTAIQKEFDKMNDTTAAKWERLKNDVEEMFVSDRAQRWLGSIIDTLRTLVKWFAADGPLAVGFKMMLMYAAAMRMQFGATFAGMGGGLKNLGLALGAAVNQMGLFTRATANARAKWKELDGAVRSNIWGAVIAALATLAYKLWDIHQAAKAAAAEVGRFNQKMADEKRALDSLFEPLSKQNLAQKDRAELMAEINSTYGKYLGYMVSETMTATQLADAHALIAKRIREEAYERRLAEKERQVYEKHDEDVNAAYGGIESAVRGGAKGNADATAIADMMKSFIDKNMNAIVESEKTLPKGFVEQINGMTDRLVLDGKLTRQGAGEVRTAMYKYLDEAKEQAVELKKATAGIRSDLRGIHGAIQTDLTRNLNSLISNIANFAKQQPQQPSPSPAKPKDNSFRFPWQGGDDNRQGGFGFGMFNIGGRQEQTVQRAPAGWKPRINEKDVEEVRQFVDHQKNLRSMLKDNSAGMADDVRDIYESWKVSDEEMDRLQKIVANADRKNGIGGGGGGNPYGSYSVMDGYDKWDADALVKRKKQMLDYVRAMANGADVQAILSQDKKFMDEATRKGIKDVRSAIEWYNTERLKIQEELADRHLTNEGNWANPSKRKGRKTRMPIADSAIAELDRYYAWRKEEMEEQRAEEGMSEAEFNRRMEMLEQEHLQKRSDLRQSYITKDEQFVTQFRKWWASVRELDAVEWELIEAEVQAATERDRKYIGMNAQKDLTAMQAITVKQLNAIEDIIAKERPYNGITENLEENLTKMHILFADFDRQREEAVRQGARKEDIDVINSNADGERFKRLSWLLKQAEDAYSLTIDEMMRRMADSGMKAWADELKDNPNGEEMQRAMLAQLHLTYDAIQDAIKKESSLIKKQADILWQDVADAQGMSLKDLYESAISALDMQQDSVSRANSLIGAGVASERVADKLAIQQLRLKISMQEHYYNLMRQTGLDRIKFLQEEARLEKAKAARLRAEIATETDEEKKREKTRQAEKAERAAAMAALDAEHVATSMNIAKAKEKAEMLKLQNEITAKVEESQNRLYTELKEWGDLLASSMREVMEASNAGNAEYYNERAKLELTGKGGPGAGTYVVIDDAGTSDAKAHYEYLDERAALERQREIEQQNAQAEAWKKVMDDLNAKMNKQITDWINAMWQNQAINANTAEIRNLEQKIAEEQSKLDINAVSTDANTAALGTLTEQLREGITIKQGEPGGISDNATNTGSEFASDKQANYPSSPVEAGSGADYQVSVPESTGDFATDRLAYYEAVSQAAQQAAQAEIKASNDVKNTIVSNTQQQQQVTTDTNKKIQTGTQSTFAKMTQAANLYGVAYQAMSNDNLSTAQKFEMFALQAAGQAAISMLTMDLSEVTAKNTMQLPGILGKLLGEMPYPAAMATFAAVTALLGGLMGVAVSQVSKSKSQISQVTGASASAGKLTTGMLAYAEGNVNEFTDPGTLTPGRQYNVDAADGRTYRARYMGSNPKTHLTNGPEFHLSGERGREMIIDAGTTRQITMNDGVIWHAIQTLSAGGRLAATRRRGSGVRAFADGNVEEFDNIENEKLNIEGDGGAGGLTPEQVAAFQSSLDRNNELLDRALTEGIKGVFNVYGKNGLIDSYDTGKKTVTRHGERY